MSNYKIIGILLLALVGGCSQDSKIDNIQNQWSGLNPTSIPLGVRLKETGKGNLITNPSFELGRHYTVDSTRLSFNLPGWRKLGEHVTWTNTENKVEFDEDDASSGIHAIKIERNSSDETEIQGEGIITDYIRVIPGNYLLSFDIRLSNIKSNLHRFGTGVFDAINIRVFCYDKNKVMIKNVGVHPLYNNEIDNSFKGFGFSNHKMIDEFGWSRVFGRSGNFPFEEGNLPQETRYVKIFAGLKGEGIMWVDKFDFRYSSGNFTLLEQLQPYFDTTLQHSDYLIPAPQEAGYYKDLQLIHISDEEEQVLPLIHLPSNAEGTVRKIISSFSRKIALDNAAGVKNLPLRSRLSADELESERLIFSIGDNSMSAQFAEQLPFDKLRDKQQSYFIKRLPQLDNIIFIGYHDLEGLKHALHTLDQLIDFRNNIYHHYDIVDYPDFLQRGVVTSIESFDSNNWQDLISGFDLLSAVGINTWIIEGNDAVLGSDPLFNNLQEWIKIDFQSLGYPFIRKGVSLENMRMPAFPEKLNTNMKPELRNYERSLLKLSKNLYDQLEGLAGKGIDLIMFSDRTLWESMNAGMSGSVLLTQQSFEKFMFYRDLFSGSFTRNDLSSLPATYLIPFFSNASGLSDIFSELYSNALTDSSVNTWINTILWSGPVKNATMIDAMDLYDFRGSSNISLLDHSLSYRTESSFYGNYYNLYPGKALSGVIFKPYDTRFTGIRPENLNSEVFMKVSGLSEVSVIRLATAADYLWNTSLYDPAISLWKALVYNYGKEVAKEIVLFNDLYFKLLSVSLDLDLNGYNQKFDKQGEELIIELNNHWDKIKVTMAEHISFLNELSDMKNTIISRFYQSQKNLLDRKNE